ncbi:MAG TPA: HEAT repeat domain-containing protein, partial [Thermomicrobiales bacterium]|nr:HEAT repeat domain-containing protein [Thermomicrobiales bacterium]
AIAEKIPTSEPGFVLLPVKANCYFDREAAQRWQGWLSVHRRDKAPPVVVQMPSVNSNWRGQVFPSAPSEAAAALAVLGRRDGTGAQLVRYLHDADIATRIGAAEALGSHLAETGVLPALLAALEGRQPDLQAAALRALGDRKSALPAAARGDDSADTAALVAAMQSTDALVRKAAASAAGAFQCPRARTALAALLDDKDKQVQLAACTSLGELKAKEGVEKLNALRAGADPRIKTAALDALTAIGALSEVDALLEKIAAGHASGTELQALARTKDPKALPALVGALQGTNLAMAAYSLAELGDREAVGPLIEALERTRGDARIPLVIALAKLGDSRAVEPIREALTLAGDGVSRRLNYVEALVALNAPGAGDDAAALLASAKKASEKQQVLQSLGR